MDEVNYLRLLSDPHSFVGPTAKSNYHLVEVASYEVY